MSGLILSGRSELSQTAPRWGRHNLSAPALHAARAILENFSLEPKPVAGRHPAKLPPNEYNVALIIDLCTCIFRLAPFVPQIKYWCGQLQSGRATGREIERFLLELSTALNKLPSYGGGVLVLEK